MPQSAPSLYAQASQQWQRLSERARITAARSRRHKRRLKALIKRIVRALSVFFATGFLTALYALLGGPIGVEGMLLAILLAFILTAIAFIYPRPAPLTADANTQQELGLLIENVENWLDRKARLMPAAASRQIDSLMAQLEQLKIPMGRIDPSSTLAGDTRRLLTQHLPRLVESYTSIASYQSNAGHEAGHRFADGLTTISTELNRIGEQLAENEVHALRIEGRFLKSRYTTSDKPSA